LLPLLWSQAAPTGVWATPFLVQVTQTVWPGSTGQVVALIWTGSPAIGSRGIRSVGSVE
jgi:hypothetical protein